MTDILRTVFLLLCLCLVTGCGEQSGIVATDEEMKAHVQEHGNLSLDPNDPSHQLELTDDP